LRPQSDTESRSEGAGSTKPLLRVRWAGAVEPPNGPGLSTIDLGCGLRDLGLGQRCGLWARATAYGRAQGSSSAPLHIRSKNGIGRQIQSGHLAIHSGNFVYHGLKFVGLVRGNAVLIAPRRNRFEGAVARCPYMLDNEA
jgi:hypothetical protein